MPTIDVTDAAQRLLGYKNILRSHCLMYVSRAIRNGEPPLRWAGLDTAWNCWQHNAGDKHTSRDVPKGFPAFLGVKRGDDDGDVIISRGDGTFAATDHPWGEVGICTLAERETETGRKFVGWAGELFGYTLTSTTTASLDLTPIAQKEEEEMAQAGAFYRVASGQGVNTIYWQAEPNAPLLALDAVQWFTYEANGAKFKDWAAGDLEPLMRRCGTYTLDKLGRIIRGADGIPVLWLPGLPA